MKIKQTLLTLLAILISNLMIGQDFQGMATYKSKRKLNIKLDSTQISGEMQKQIMDRMKKQFEKTYKLTFNKETSIYKEEESLGSPQAAGGNVRVMMVDSRGGDILYKNTKESRFTNQNEVFGKIFLIKDDLQKLDWKLESETKNIGNYTCYKATMKRTQRVRRQATIRVNRNEGSEEEEEREPEMEEITVTAWYTPQIPIYSGPGNYYGLPGLILEVNDGTETVICSKVVINPKNKIDIIEPTKGKEVSQEKFDEILEKKMKEMRKNREGRRNAEGMRIRVGG